MLSNSVLAWVEYARNDIELGMLAMNSVRNPRLRPHELILYHCHQCAEKMLKAYLLHSAGKYDKIHTLDVLRKSCLVYDIGFNIYMFTRSFSGNIRRALYRKAKWIFSNLVCNNRVEAQYVTKCFTNYTRYATKRWEGII